MPTVQDAGDLDAAACENRRRPAWKSVSGCAVAEAGGDPAELGAGRRSRRRPPRPARRWTTVPISAQLVRSASAVPGRRPASVSLSTGSDSPVRTDSSHARPVVARSRRSAGHDLAQPQLDDVAGHEVDHVDRRRPAVPDDDRRWRTCSCRAAAARSARYSLTKPRPTRREQDDADDDRVGAVAEGAGESGRHGEEEQQRRPELPPQHRECPRPVHP